MTTTDPDVSPDLDPQLAALLEFMAAANTKPMAESTPAEARAGFRTLCVDLRDPALLPEMADVEDIAIPGPAGSIPARVYRPEPRGATALPTLVMYHGGGFVIGDLDTHDLTARTLATGCGAVVVSVDYRLAPEHAFPAAADDALAALRWTAEHIADLGGDDRLAVCGDSAGANLAAVVAQVARDEGLALAGQLLIYPAVDMVGDYPSMTENAEGYFLDAATMGWFMTQYVGALCPEELADPRVSPLQGDLAGLAPAVVVVAQFDPLRDQGTAYAEALAAAGVPVSHRVFAGLVHGFVDMGRHSAAAQAAVEDTCRLFREVLHG